MKPARKNVKKPEVVISIVYKDDQVLLIERRDMKGVTANYVFPGGKVEPGESLKDASEREVLEETGLRCEAVKEIGFRIHPKTKTRIHYWLCRYINRDRDAKPEFNIFWSIPADIKVLVGEALAPAVRRELDHLNRLESQPS